MLDGLNPGGIDPGWLWLIGGVLLLIFEVIAPGFFLVFVGAAAMATGLFTVLFGLGTTAQLALFALYALLAVMVGRRFYANAAKSGDPLLNDRSARLVGKVVTVGSASTSITAASGSATARERAWWSRSNGGARAHHRG